MVSISPLYCPHEDPALLKLLEDSALTLPSRIDIGIGLYESNEIIGCGFLCGNMLQGLTINQNYRGLNLSAALVSALIQQAAQRGILHLNILTKPSMAPHLIKLGLRRVADASPHAIFLEYGPNGVKSFIEKLQETAHGKPDQCACIVINGNPFTKGHRFLIEKASREAPWVWVIVVQEDISVFPFSTRLRLLQEGTADLSNVQVLSGGEYVISNLTFPSYFTKKTYLSAAQATVDAAIFSQIIVPSLNISSRYLGTEIKGTVTSIYHQILREQLSLCGVQVVDVPRLSIGGQVVSASSVRCCIRENRWDLVQKMVPDVTYQYLCSDTEEVQSIIECIKMGGTPHDCEKDCRSRDVRIL